MNQSQNLNPKIVGVLLLSQSLLTAAAIMSITVTATQVVDLAGGESAWTGVPSTVTLIGAALISYPVGWLMDTLGRRPGLALGHVFGIGGALVAGWGAVSHSLILFLVGIFVLGFNRGTVELGRFAAADASPPQQRARAISLVVLGGTVGSIVSAPLIALAGWMTTRLDLPEALGPWLISAATALAGAVLIGVFLRPDPRDIARQMAAQEAAVSGVRKPARPFREIAADWRFGLAAAAMVAGQLAMVIVMVITPIHMRGHQHANETISWVITAHTLGMFAFSFAAGWLADKIGSIKVILIGGGLLILACVTAPLESGAVWLAGALFLLGLGWSLCFVAGSALLNEVLAPSEKGRMQGGVNTLVQISSGAGSLGSGVMFSRIGFATTSWLTIVVAAVPLVLALILMAGRGRTKPRESPVAP